MNKHNPIHGLALAAVLASLAACGSGDSTDPPAAMPVPAFDTTSPQAFSAGLSTLAADDTAEPLDVEALSPPTSETDEPIDLS